MNSRSLPMAIALCALIVLSNPQRHASAAAADPVPPPVAAVRMLPMEVTVNGLKSGAWLLMEKDGVLYAPLDAFEEWRVRLDPKAAPIEFKGQSYASLASIPGFRFKVDFSTLSLSIQFSPEAFAGSDLRREQPIRLKVSPVLSSVFVNYDINVAANSYRNAASTQDLGLITEWGLSTGLGVLTVSHAGRNLLSNRALGESRQWSRLETTFTRDFPERNQTLRLGDSTTRPGLSGRNAYFGGIQFATNFALTPGFVRQPLPRLQGISAAPSTVELYVNDVLRQVSNVPTGPFTLDNFPVLSGGGEARLVVRDILGRETVISQSFLTSAQLLAPGLDDWSLEAGRIRDSLGIGSGRYGARFAALTWARGLNDALTVELRGEATGEFRQGSLGFVSALPQYFLGHAAFAASRHERLGAGQSWLVGLERQGLRNNLSLEIRGASRGFRQLGLDDTTPAYRRQAAANWTYAAEGGTSLGLGLARIEAYDAQPVTTLSANLTFRVLGQGNLAFNATRAISGGTGTSSGMTLTLPLERQRILSSSISHRSGGTDAYAALAQNPGPDSNLGWRMLAGEQQGSARVEGGSYHQGRYAISTADVSLNRDQRALRLGAKGGLVFTDGQLFATRRVDDSFALVEVAGYGGIGIGIGNTTLARTDEKGTALVPRLNAYQPNAIRLNPRELPLSAELDTIEQTVVPPWRSAVKVVFPVRSGRGALVRIVFDDGQPAPAGSTVRIVGDKQEFFVARRGEAFVTGLQSTNQLDLSWNGKTCRFAVDLPAASEDEYPRIGPLACKGVPR
ncbi:MAG TPA: fimbria/pilus outer membrane usher protein [Usitatibacteraceae bacterium]|nr:fimbria/pilus outer membrane usher protein [Usitatibacteraceae bacterium]